MAVMDFLNGRGMAELALGHLRQAKRLAPRAPHGLAKQFVDGGWWIADPVAGSVNTLDARSDRFRYDGRGHFRRALDHDRTRRGVLIGPLAAVIVGVVAVDVKVTGAHCGPRARARTQCTLCVQEGA
jgi:hypothetical protein